MPLTDSGRDLISNLLVGTSAAAFVNSSARIGVGDSAAAFSSSQTDLLASSNKIRKGMDPGFPTITGNALTFRATFNTSEANFAWQEWGVFNAASGPTMLNRKVESLGTKAPSQSWQITCVLTVNNP